MAKLTREAWLQAGFKALDRQGHEAVSAQMLARRLNVTRGSFYHHFASRADFVEQLLQRWEHDYTVAVIADARSASGPVQQLQRHVAFMARLHPGREVAIRAWAFKDAQVRAALHRVEALRVAFTREAVRALLPASTPQAMVEAFARVTYLGFVGMQQAGREGDPPFQRFVDDLALLGGFTARRG